MASTETTRLSSMLSLILYRLALAGSHDNGRILRENRHSQGLLWSGLRTSIPSLLLLLIG